MPKNIYDCFKKSISVLQITDVIARIWLINIFTDTVIGAQMGSIRAKLLFGAPVHMRNIGKLTCQYMTIVPVCTTNQNYLFHGVIKGLCL